MHWGVGLGLSGHQRREWKTPSTEENPVQGRVYIMENWRKCMISKQWLKIHKHHYVCIAIKDSNPAMDERHKACPFNVWPQASVSCTTTQRRLSRSWRRRRSRSVTVHISLSETITFIRRRYDPARWGTNPWAARRHSSTIIWTTERKDYPRGVSLLEFYAWLIREMRQTASTH